ncbi:hypothetical protein [Paracoccus fistulariae]|uniref:DUF4169 family protein n=1 Tax=Paracoccus fistulariae TaxID=658446 RepID=A0ABY7SJF3_9RHOB|nr:hypothetical protein [Paracoccus fistulariae]MDB6180623.1 hypothetical protein [Paracoccus fistulariae]WCR07140.1 hypothetical protein JHX87_17060 [Paracoccus fistulariae]
MNKRSDDSKKPESREDRLRAALRANLQRRKAQARARADKPDQDNGVGSDTGGDDS